MINFDNLPQDNPFALPDVDLYMAKIAEAKMTKSEGKPDYLNLKLQLTDHKGKSAGVVYDIISESDKSVVQYKTARFVRACGLPLVGAMELSDIAKLVQNKDIAVSINHSKETKYKGKTYPPKAQVDIFSGEAYYLPTEFEEIYTLVHPSDTPAPDFEPVTDADSAFNAPDGDANTGSDLTEY